MTNMNTSHIEYMKGKQETIKNKNFSTMSEEELDSELRALKRLKQRQDHDREFLLEESKIDRAIIELTTKPEMFRKVTPEWEYEKLDEYWDLKFQKFKKQQDMKLKFFEEEQKAYEEMKAFLDVQIEYVEELLKKKQGEKNE